ncbi:MAG: 23S rRNA (guanosine(2251)-2'-O)-methyltransferase RlmB [Proteobacteria bacterium]|nr:23S rRNA (guanosine(2251)-2'-O)-methyltransferase RlmB [Pseudomonadota bacterium]
MPEKPKQMLVGQHSVISALEKKLHLLDHILVAENSIDKYKQVLYKVSKQKIQVVDKKVLNKKTDQPHQGIIAFFKQEKKSVNFDKIIEESNLIVLLDQVTDPHNVGAIIRSSDAFGAGAVVTTSKNAATDSPIIAKSSSGAIENTPLVTVSNLNNTIKALQKEGFWVVGLDGYANEEIQKADLKGKIALVMGSEGSGLRKLVKENCDLLVKLPMIGSVESLNVSVACGVSLYEVQRQNTNVN